MKPIERNEVLSLGDYEAIRSPFRGRVVASKALRRVSVGPHMSVLFENRDTVLLQIQEMLRTERITQEAGIAHEITTYNELVPADGQLSMTLFIEVIDEDERNALLMACAGMESHVFLEVDGERCKAIAADRDGAVVERTTAVQYYRTRLGAAAAKALATGACKSLALVIDHPGYAQRVALGPELITQLAADLSWSS